MSKDDKKVEWLRVCIENALRDLSLVVYKTENTRANLGRTPALLLAQALVAKGVTQ